MTRLVLVLLRAYLGLFAVFVHDREHARREHSLIEGSLRESYAARRAEGSGRARAARASLWEHLGELQPLALFSKTRADTAYAAGELPRDRGLLVLAVVLGATVVSPVVAFLLGPAAVTVVWIGLPLLGLLTFLAAMVASYRRSHDRWLVALAVAAALWPVLRGWALPGETSFAAVLTVSLLAAAFRHGYHRRNAAGFAILGITPLTWQLSWFLRVNSLPGFGEVESYTWPLSLVADGARSVAELYSLALATALALHLCLLALALLSLSDGRREAPGGREHRIASS